MTMNDEALGQLMASVAPDLPQPIDRVAAVKRRVRRQRQWVVAVAAAAVTGVVLVGGTVLASRGEQRSGPLPPPIGVTPPPVPADGVLRTPGCANYPVAPPTKIDGTPVSGNSEVTNEQNNKIFPYATSHFPDAFALTEVTDTGRLRVYRKPSAAFDAWIMRDFASECVEIADAKMSSVEFSQVLNLVLADAGYWHGRGIEILSVGGSPAVGDVIVGVTAASLEKARQQIPAHYPGLQITVQVDEALR